MSDNNNEIKEKADKLKFDMSKKERTEQERIVLAYQINYMKYNVDKSKFPLVTSLPPEVAVELTNKIGEKHPKMLIKRILTILEKDLSKISKK